MHDTTIRTFFIAFLFSFLILFTSTASYSDVIIDNGSVGTSYAGSWSLSGGTDPYGNSSLWSRNGATYTFSMNGQQAGTYEVLMWWSGSSSRAPAVPVMVNYTGGTKNLIINQLENAGQWNSLGTYDFDGSGSVTITAATGDTLSTCADAVQFRYVPGPTQDESIIDNSDSTRTSRTGTWSVSSAPNYYQTGSVWSRDGATFTWKFTPSQTGRYNVSMWWTTTSTRSSSIPVRIENASGSQTVTINQLQNAGVWNSLGTFSFSAGVTYNIVMTSQPGPTSTCADAMKFTFQGSGVDDLIIDNTDPRTSRTGTWTASAAAGYYGTDSVWSRDGTTFTWKFTPQQTAAYTVSMWWTTTSTRSPSVPVTINYAGGSQVVTINQLARAGQWNTLGTYPFTAGTTYNITITSQPGPTSTCADAVKFSAGAVATPDADFAADPVTGNAPLAVQFTDLSTGQIGSWLWNFGDGSTSTVRNPSHTYSASGYYTVSLTISGSWGSNTETKARYINVTSANVEHIYIGDGYASDSTFLPNVKIMLKNLGATDAGDTWYYTDKTTGKNFALHFVTTTAGFISSLKQPDAHIIWNGHSNYGLGGSFAQGYEIYDQQIDSIRYIDDDRFTHVSTPMVSVKVDGMQYGQAYPNWSPQFKDGRTGVMPYTFSQGMPPYNYYLTYRAPGDQALYKIELLDGSNIERFWDSGVPAWFSASGIAPDPVNNPEYFIVNNDDDFNRCDFTGTWNILKEADEDLREYNGYNYQYHAAGSGANAAEWTIVVREPADYQVTATWQSSPGNASIAKYSIQHSNGTKTVQVDQRVKTAGYPMGVFHFNPGTYKIKLNDNADGRVVADSVRLSSLEGFSERLQAEFSAPAPGGSNPLTVSFKDLSEIYSASGATITEWFWDFGDGTTSTSQNPQHKYTRSGTYTVTLTVTSSTGSRDTEIKTGLVRVGTTGPLRALFAADTRNVTTRTSVQFTDMSSGSPRAWLWDFGDGETSTEQNPMHRYKTAGTYPVSLTVQTSQASDTLTNPGYIQSIKSAFTVVSDNAYHYRPHFFDRSGSYGKTIIYGNTAINQSDLKYARMFYASCNSCQYYAGNFNRGIFFCTMSDSELYTGVYYLQYYIQGMGDSALLKLLNTYQDVHEMINFNLKPPSLR